MSQSPAWNPEEKRNDNRMRRGTSRDRQQNGGLPPGRNYRPGGYNNKDGGYGKDRGYDGRRHQYNNRNRAPEPDHHFLPHHNPGLNFEMMPMRPGDGLMSMNRPPPRPWNGGPSPPMHSSTPSPIPPNPPPAPTPSGQMVRQMLNNSGGRKTNDSRDSIGRKSPEVGSKLDENRDDIPYVAAGTAPVNRNGSSPTPAKSASPVPMPLVTNFAGPVLTVNRSYPPGFEDQFDVRSNASSEPPKPHYTSNPNQDNRMRRDKRHERQPYFPVNEQDRQVINQLNVFQHILKGNSIGNDREMRMALERLAENRVAAEQQQQQQQQHQTQHRGNDNRRRGGVSDDDRHRTYPVSGRPIPRFAGDENSMLAAGAQRTQKSGGGGGGDLVPSGDVVNTMLKFMQQQQTSGSSPTPLDQEDGGKHLEQMISTSKWPSVCLRSDSDSSSRESPTPPQTSPVKQNYSAVVARSSRSSTSDVPKEAASVLYSTKAASNVVAEGKDARFDLHHNGQRQQHQQNLCPPQMGVAVAEGRGLHNNHRGGYKESQRGGGSPVLPVSIAAAVAAAASSKQRNADPSLNAAAKTQPPSPPPTTPVDNQGHFEVSKMDVLSEQIWHYHNSITQTEGMLQRKLHLRDMLYYAISPIFPMCGLYVVGSSLNGFGNNSSDMDLCLMITNKDLDQKTDAVVVLNMILSTLSKLEWVSNQQLILAKVPILRIKFTSPWQDITVDLNANNSVAIKNTHLLCYYSSFDWRVRPLVSVVKEWAKRKGINDANRSSFTSYSLVLMVIHYLQCGAEPAILPSLQMMFPKRFNQRADVRSLNVTQPLQHPQEEWHYHDKTTLGELFIGFLDYYANKFDYNRDAISVRQGRRVDRAVLARHRPNGVPHSNHWRSQWRCICIEEPFTQSNTAHSIYDEMVFDAIKTAFRNAHDELEKNRDLQSLLNCKPISVSLPHNGAVVYAYDNSAAATDSSAVPSPTQDLMCSSSANSLNTAMTRSSSSANSMNDGEETEKEPQAERPRRKSTTSRRHHNQHAHHRKSSTSTTTPALVASS